LVLVAAGLQSAITNMGMDRQHSIERDKENKGGRGAKPTKNSIVAMQ
jgi:hypothetical protein